MASPEILIRSIVGDIRPSIRSAAYAADVMGYLIFACHIPLDEINAAKQVYPLVAEELGRRTEAVSRNIQRLSKICWEKMVEKNLVVSYIGQELKYAPNACRLIGYLTVYAHLQIPFFTAIERDPALLFRPAYDSPLHREKALFPVYRAKTYSRKGPSWGCCPICGGDLNWRYQNYCDYCGQCLNWTQPG